MAKFVSIDKLPTEVGNLLDKAVEEKLSKLLCHILSGCRIIAESLRAGDEYSTKQVGTQNSFGDNQLFRAVLRAQLTAVRQFGC